MSEKPLPSLLSLVCFKNRFKCHNKKAKLLVSQTLKTFNTKLKWDCENFTYRITNFQVKTKPICFILQTSSYLMLLLQCLGYGICGYLFAALSDLWSDVLCCKSFQNDTINEIPLCYTHSHLLDQWHIAINIFNKLHLLFWHYKPK